MAQIANLEGRNLERAPDWTLSLTAAYRKELEAGVLQASASAYHSARYYFDANNRIDQPSYTTLTAQLAFQPRGTKVRLSIYGRDLTDEHLIQSSFVTTQADGASFGPPRTFGGQIEYSF